MINRDNRKENLYESQHEWWDCINLISLCCKNSRAGMNNKNVEGPAEAFMQIVVGHFTMIMILASPAHMPGQRQESLATETTTVLNALADSLDGFWAWPMHHNVRHRAASDVNVVLHVAKDLVGRHKPYDEPLSSASRTVEAQNIVCHVFCLVTGRFLGWLRYHFI